MTAHAKSVFEAEARHAKVMALCRELDRQLRNVAKQTRFTPDDVVRTLRGWGDAEWHCLALESGLVGKSGKVLTPSKQTRDAVVDEYAARAEEAPPQEFFDECAKYCRCCPSCSERPCAGTMAGGMCDEVRCSCFDESDLDDIYQEDP